MLLAGVGATAALLAARRGTPGGFDDSSAPPGGSACGAGSLVDDGPSLHDNMAIVMDTTACMSTLYGHASQYLREVRPLTSMSLCFMAPWRVFRA